MYYVRLVGFASIALFTPFVQVGAPAVAVAERAPRPNQVRPVVPGSDVRELGSTRFGVAGRTSASHRGARRGFGVAGSPAAGTPAVGTRRDWLGLDEVSGKYYPKKFTLRAVGRHIEVWVADDLGFPVKDCRKDATGVTDAQIGELITDFDQTIYPKETAAFSTPPDRNGTTAAMDGDFTGDGDKTVTLIDNIRDKSYYDFPATVTYLAGFFSPQLNELFDRNVMTIDSYDWNHRFGAHPADNPSDDLCTSRPARPRLYESTFAHEWQHLLEYYVDPAETTWVNEGLSDYAQTLVGYVDSSATVDEPGADIHLICFQGFGDVRTKYNVNPRECGGPQNSLNLWDEGEPNDVLADYGNAYQFMLYLSDRFGPAIISKLHRDRTHQGLAGVQAALPAGVDLYDILHDFQTMTLVDKIVGNGGSIDGVPLQQVTSASLRSTVNLANPADYGTAGAAPNGADYVPLPTPVRSVKFAGATNLPSLSSGWTIADKTMFSGNADNLDNTTIREMAVPTKNARLKLETSFDIEDSYDFGYVTVSTDGGKTYTPLEGDRTTTGPLGPGLTGRSGGVVTAGYDLSPYAGEKVLIGVRYVTDGVGHRGGWRIGNITLGDRPVSDGTTLDGWKSPSQVSPTPVHGWHVTLIGLDGNHAKVVPVARFAELAAYPKVVAIVAFDEPTETVKQYAPYRLMVNGKLQPGGSADQR